MLPHVICYGGLNHSEKVATIVGIRNSSNSLVCAYYRCVVVVCRRGLGLERDVYVVKS